MTKILFILLSSSLVWATSGEEVKQKTKEAVNAAGDYTVEKKAEFQKSMEENLASLKADLKALKAQASDKTGETKEKINAEIADLEKKQSQLQADLKKLKKSTGAAWSEIKNGMSKAWDATKESYEKAKSKFH